MATAEEVLARTEERLTEVVQCKMKPSQLAFLKNKAKELDTNVSTLLRAIAVAWIEEQ